MPSVFSLRSKNKWRFHHLRDYAPRPPTHSQVVILLSFLKGLSRRYIRLLSKLILFWPVAGALKNSYLIRDNLGWNFNLIRQKYAYPKQRGNKFSLYWWLGKLSPYHGEDWFPRPSSRKTPPIENNGEERQKRNKQPLHKTKNKINEFVELPWLRNDYWHQKIRNRTRYWRLILGYVSAFKNEYSKYDFRTSKLTFIRAPG